MLQHLHKGIFNLSISCQFHVEALEGWRYTASLEWLTLREKKRLLYEMMQSITPKTFAMDAWQGLIFHTHPQFYCCQLLGNASNIPWLFQSH